MTNTDQSIILSVVNQWHSSLIAGELEGDASEGLAKIDFDVSGKFSDKFIKHTGNFVKMTKRVENSLLKKICESLSEKYTLTESLLDEYLEWCFANSDYISKRAGGFNLVCIAKFAPEWDKDKFKNTGGTKTIIDLSEIKNIKEGFFYYCEKYGIPIASTKLLQETSGNREKLKELVLKKLEEASKTQAGLARIKNMLVKTIENEPYDKSYMFHNYRLEFAFLFKYFRGEAWTI